MRLTLICSVVLVATHVVAAPSEGTPRAPEPVDASQAVAPRDPFRSLVGGVSSDAARGLEGMLLADLKLTGVTRTPQGVLATLENAVTGAFFVVPGERLKDGVIVAIDAERGAVRIRQADPGPSGSRDVVLELGRAR